MGELEDKDDCKRDEEDIGAEVLQRIAPIMTMLRLSRAFFTGEHPDSARSRSSGAIFSSKCSIAMLDISRSSYNQINI